MPSTTRSIARRLRRPALLLAAAYASWCAVLFFAQSSLIFPTWVMRPAPASPPDRARVLTLTADDGLPIIAHFYPSPAGPRPAPAVIFAHGNAELIHDHAQLAAMYHRWGFSVLLPEYRGYGDAPGSPSEAAIVADFARFFDDLIARPEVDPALVIFHGRSLGGGVVAQLASRRQPAAIILESTFTSMASFSRSYGVPSFLVRHPFRSDRALASIGPLPTLIIHGRADNQVPFSHALALHRLLPHATLFPTDDGHNDLPRDPAAYAAAIRAFLEAHRLLPADPG